MKVLITGSSKGIGKTVSERFLSLGYEVHGLDRLPSSIQHPNYIHHLCDVKDKDTLPTLEDINILFINAGTQNDNDIQNNFFGAVNTMEKYGYLPSIKSILFNASASARSGQEFPLYAASKGAIVTYMKNVAIKLAPKGITVNSISLGGVLTDSNNPVIEDKTQWDKIMKVTPMKKWMTLEEVSDWVIFLTTKNKSMSGQDILIDNGEHDLNSTFVWPEE